MGFECRPPIGNPQLRPLPGAEAPFGPALPRASSCSALVVSHHLDGLLRNRVTGLLHPATDQGFAAFHACRLPAPPEGDLAGRVPIPATRFTPFEEFPSPVAAPHHCGRCLPAVTVLPGAGSPTEVGFRCRPPARRGGWRTRRCSCPRGAGLPCPEGRGPMSREMGGPGLRGGPGFQSRGPGARGLRRAPVAGARLEVPALAESGSVASEEVRCPVPVGGGAVLRGARCPVPARPVRDAPRSAAACPSGRGAQPVTRSGPAEAGSVASEEVRCPVPVGWGADAPKSSGSLSRWSLARGAPRGADCWTPARPCGRCPEGRRLPCPGGPGFLAYVSSGLWPGSRWGAAPPKRCGSLSRVEWGAAPPRRCGSLFR
jgi:hypothetical protein